MVRLKILKLLIKSLFIPTMSSYSATDHKGFIDVNSLIICDDSNDVHYVLSYKSRKLNDGSY